MRGKVIRVIGPKGYAFVRDAEGNERIAPAAEFKPFSAFDRLREGMTVEFTPNNRGKGGNGLRAEKISVCSS